MTTLLSPKISSKRTNPFLKDDLELPSTPKSPAAPQSPTASLHAAVPLLASESLHDNQKGLQILMTLTKLTKWVSISKYNLCEKIVLKKHDPMARRIRTLLLSFMCDDVDIRESPEESDDDSLISALSDVTYGLSEATTWDDDLDDFESDRDHPCGRHWGALHFASLRFLVDCMQHLTRTKSPEIKIDYSCEFWRSMVQTLSRNIERGSPAKLCELSLRCLRLLTTLDSRSILPMIKYTLLPYILNLQECGGADKSPRVQSEAAKLLELAMSRPLSRRE
jgi:hypothetical protein